MGPACAKVRKQRIAKVLLINSVKGMLTKLLYVCGDAKRFDYKTNRN